MSTTMTATLMVSATGTSPSTAIHTFEAEAYDRIEISIPSTESSTVEVQPGSGQVQLLQITASAYPHAGDGTPQLTYTVDGGSAINLDAPLLAVGSGAVGLLGDVNSVEFDNQSDDTVNIQIVVGRDATP
ncbi:MAG: hypothetical protein PVF33_12955 [Candidatus Latescibacterota bacterium]|jgi:hypothetical protein